MRKALCTLITYSLPAPTSFHDYSLFNFFAETAPTVIDGVTSAQAGDYYSPFFPWVSLISPSLPRPSELRSFI
jgi:hypothetical protein